MTTHKVLGGTMPERPSASPSEPAGTPQMKTPSEAAPEVIRNRGRNGQPQKKRRIPVQPTSPQVRSGFVEGFHARPIAIAYLVLIVLLPVFVSLWLYFASTGQDANAQLAYSNLERIIVFIMGGAAAAFVTSRKEIVYYPRKDAQEE